MEVDISGLALLELVLVVSIILGDYELLLVEVTVGKTESFLLGLF